MFPERAVRAMRVIERHQIGDREQPSQSRVIVNWCIELQNSHKVHNLGYA
jgi:hypothetical protein